MTQVLRRSPGTDSRELRRNLKSTGCASATANTCVQRRRQQSRPPFKFHPDGILFDLMRHFLSQRWSPEQLALPLARISPKGHKHRVSRETIYNCICAQPLGELKRELITTCAAPTTSVHLAAKGKFRRGQIPADS